MIYAYFENDVWTQITGDFTLNGEAYTVDEVLTSSVDALSELGIRPIEEDLNPAPGIRGARTLVDDNGTPRWKYTLLPIPDVAAEEAAMARRALIEARMDQAFGEGFPPNHPAFAGETLQIREKDQTKWLIAKSEYKDLAEAGAGAMMIAVFRTTSDRNITVSINDALAIFSDMAKWGMAIQQRSWALKDAEAAGEPYDLNTGWPGQS
jgi:hypothetical protein